jgi:uncharacterized protein YggU (UPF0235/DUF167 family)
LNGYHWEHDVLALNLHVQPKAARLKPSIKAAPIDGKAAAIAAGFPAL